MEFYNNIMLWAVLVSCGDGYTFSCNNELQGIFSSYEKAKEFVAEYIKNYPKAQQNSKDKDCWELNGQEDTVYIELVEVDKPI